MLIKNLMSISQCGNVYWGSIYILILKTLTRSPAVDLMLAFLSISLKSESQRTRKNDHFTFLISMRKCAFHLDLWYTVERHPCLVQLYWHDSNEYVRNYSGLLKGLNSKIDGYKIMDVTLWHRYKFCNFLNYFLHCDT